ncbi:FAD-binding oxidoreductase [Rhodobacteraceae bacterium]|nr:FAD-binding oxidoreductase [Paracoccaceae bacterium]
MAYGSVRGQLTRRAALFGGGAAVGAYAGAKLSSKVPSLVATQSLQPKGAADTLNDASLLNETPVFRHITIQENPGDALIARLRIEMDEARAEGRPFNVGAARHSMGGHAIPENGHAVTFDNGLLETDVTTLSYRVHPGARWSQVISALDLQGMSPKVMQSNNDFGVAATFCVNAHGWPVPHGPMGATVKSFFLLRPDGELMRVSRDEFPEIFNLTMGGYGLTGAIIDMEVEMVVNKRLVPTFQNISSRDFAPFFIGAIEAGDVNMAYGRLNVDRDRFFEDALMITYREEGDQLALPAASGSEAMSDAAALVFRAQLMNETAKDIRWWFESSLGPRINAGDVTRNSLLNEPVVTLDDGDPTRTDILHEYFVPPVRFAEFVTACQEVIPSSYQEMLNITLRYVAADRESVLAYAPGPRIACVMLFSQEMTLRAEADHRRMTEALIERTLELGGTYYLPYRPHARADQFLRGYPRAEEFVAAKLELDPDRLFRNMFWDTYLEGLV